MGAVDDFLDGLDRPVGATLARIRDLAVTIAPDAEQGTSYGMPALRVAGRPLVGFTVSKDHLSLHPFSPAVVESVAADLPGFSLSKGTIRFTVEQPIPDPVVERIVRTRLAEITGA